MEKASLWQSFLVALFPKHDFSFPLWATFMLWRNSEPQIHANCYWSRTKWIIYFLKKRSSILLQTFQERTFSLMLQPSCFSCIYMWQECCFVSKLAHPSRIAHLFFFVSVVLILKNMNYSQRIPYIFKTFLLNENAYLIPLALDYPQWGIIIWIVEDNKSQAALYVWLHPPCLCQTCSKVWQFVLLWHKNL